jgi:hypothetical protein
MRIATLFALFLSLTFSVSGAEPNPVRKPKAMITLQQLEEMFTNMRAKTKWNLDGEMLWGYFFIDPDAKKLDPVAKYLSEIGYHVVAIYPTDDAKTQMSGAACY